MTDAYELEEIAEQAADLDSIHDVVELYAKYELSQEEIDDITKMMVTPGLENFCSPDEYESVTFGLNPILRMICKVHGIPVQGYIHATEHEKLKALADRLDAGLHAYLDEDPYTSIFVFISVQDGMMTWLCEHLDVDKDNDGYYSAERKQNVLAEEFRTRVEQGDRLDLPVDTGDFIGNLKCFYQHRNAIMHGDHRASFDMNIATIAFFFLLFTFEVLQEHRDIEPIQVPADWFIPF